MTHTVLRHINPLTRVQLACVLLSCVLLSACGVGNSSPVPVGTWKDVDANRYITISTLSPDERTTGYPSTSSAKSAHANGDLQTAQAGFQKPWDKPEYQQQYTALLFSVHEVEAANTIRASSPTPTSTSTETASKLNESVTEPLTTKMHNKLVIKERSLPAFMKEGVLTLKAGATEISVLYHPSGELILVNGSSEFRRVPEEEAKITLAKLQDP